jgi:hypothetical protein
LTTARPERYTRPVTRKQRVTRAVYGGYVLLVAAFTVSSITQVARKVFGGPGEETADSRFPKVGADCGEALRSEIGAIEAARALASLESGGDTAKARYASERTSRGTMNDLKRRCGTDPHGQEALAALARLDRAAEAHAVRDGSELSPVRLSAQSFISGHPR